MTELPVSSPPPRPLQASLNHLTRALGIPDAAALETVFSRWTELVGPAVAAHAQPVSMRDGVLLEKVDEPAWGTELRYRAQELLTRIGRELGPGTPTRIEVRVWPEMPGQEPPRW